MLKSNCQIVGVSDIETNEEDGKAFLEEKTGNKNKNLEKQ